jgi:hypothetical protein
MLYLNLCFESTDTVCPIQGIQLLLETTTSLELLHVRNYFSRSLDPFTNGLKHNTSAKQLTISGMPQGREYDVNLVVEVLRYQNLTLTYTEP